MYKCISRKNRDKTRGPRSWGKHFICTKFSFFFGFDFCPVRERKQMARRRSKTCQNAYNRKMEGLTCEGEKNCPTGAAAAAIGSPLGYCLPRGLLCTFAKISNEMLEYFPAVNTGNVIVSWLSACSYRHEQHFCLTSLCPSVFLSQYFLFSRKIPRALHLRLLNIFVNILLAHFTALNERTPPLGLAHVSLWSTEWFCIYALFNSIALHQVWA